MSFNQIVWKMAKAHYKKYIFYYLCNSFAVMFFFIFSSVYFNQQVVQVKKTESIQYVLTVPGVALIVFTVFFISYAHSIFIKRRKSEFGLFMTLGMSNRDIGKLLLLENGIIAFASLASGILGGTIFSRLFFLVLMGSVGIQGISFHLTSKMFLYTIVIFLLVFLVAVGRSLFFVLKQNVVLSLKSDKIAESINMKSPLIGVIGMAIVIGSILGLYYTYTDPIAGGEYLLLWTLSTMLGLYMSIYQFTSFFIEIAKKNKSFYYRRLLLLTSLDYKFKQLTSILMLVTVMIMVTILYSTINLFTYMLAEKDAIEGNPYDIAFIQTENKNNLGKEELYSIIDQKDNPIQKHLVIPIYSHYQKQTYSNLTNVYSFMALDQYNKLTSSNMELQDKEFLYYINDDPKNTDGNEYYQNNAFSFPDESRPYTLKEIIVEKHINLISSVQDINILNNSQLEQLKNSLDVFESNIHLINVVNWKKSSDVVDKLSEEFKNYNETTPPINDIRVENTSEEFLFQVASKVEDYNRNKNSNGILFYVTTILSVIFFLGSFILLYLNLFSEIEKEQEKFKKLNNIGITRKEIKQIISKEITILFFFPTIVGTTLAFLFIVAMAKDIGGVVENPQILLHFLIVTGIYHFIQMGFYLYARKKMFFSLTHE
ncbi:ABC transporter permease [Bacillus sp. REN16]|uniref:ABC transporter permease n=1 Tax=Bacillus sp. REN16 TaxID=2887296 RepID=UPI001E32F91A|nr:ABC transporter permease [Bacillus sp. REN16]MCC3359472.1 ABC transporter permease [Bacillus sp. REN16]